MADKKPATAPKKLYKSQDDKKIFGVAGGIAEYFGVDSTIVRLLWVVLGIVTAFVPAIIGYIIAAIIIPDKP
ncbi:MAG TPA: PspC domain-containing protein [Candidatus Saccharimonadales bacterium]|jgi:phage shock protein C